MKPFGKTIRAPHARSTLKFSLISKLFTKYSKFNSTFFFVISSFSQNLVIISMFMLDEIFFFLQSAESCNILQLSFQRLVFPSNDSLKHSNPQNCEVVPSKFLLRRRHFHKRFGQFFLQPWLFFRILF